MLIRLRYAALGVMIAASGAGVPAAIVTGVVKVGYAQSSRPGAWAAMAATAAVTARSTPFGTAVLSPPPRLIVPDLVAVRPAGLSAVQVSEIGGLAGVRVVLAVDGGRVMINGRAASVLGVPAEAFRSWTPPATAAAAGIWARLAEGQIIADQAAAGRLGLAAGRSYLVSGASSVPLRLGTTATLGIPGVDAIVSSGLSGRLGLTAGVAMLINAPGADLGALMRQVQGILGSGGTVRNLVPVVTSVSLPVDDNVPAGPPASWLGLYRESAAEYCPGLSWTVLAAIGEIESNDGANDGPSSAGALGPMQFMPSTWKIWGTDGFGRTGPPDIMNALDAVPSAARMLCRRRRGQRRRAVGGHLRLQPRGLVRQRGARPGRGVRAGVLVNRRVAMRHGTGRLLAACLIGTGAVAWGLIGGLPGIAHAAAGGQQCEPLTAASASPSASASTAQLCVTVQASQASVKRGQAALFAIQVSTQNGPASGVSVTLTATPSDQAATFTASCPGGNGSATCAVGSLATAVAPAAYQMQAQIAVPATAGSSVTSVTLTATADAAVSPAMAAEPAVAATVTVTAAASASPSPSKKPSSKAPSSTAAATSPAAAISPVSTATLPTVAPITLAPTPAGVPTTVLTPQSVASDLPTITPVAVVPTPVTESTGSPVADTGSPEAGSFTLSLNMSSATAQVFGIIIVALALTLAATKLVADQFTARRNTGARPAKRIGHSRTAGRREPDVRGTRRSFFRRSRIPPQRGDAPQASKETATPHSASSNSSDGSLA